MPSPAPFTRRQSTCPFAPAAPSARSRGRWAPGAWAVVAAIWIGCAPGGGGIHARMAWSEEGLRVVDVPPDGPAATAGLQAGDRIVTIEGTPVSTLTIREAVERLRGPVGSTVEIEAWRDGEVVPLEIRRLPYER